MGGGELELALAGGQMDEYFTSKGSAIRVSPKITFFKAVYQKYHNFSQESVSLQFDKHNVNRTKETVMTCSIKRYGQLMQNVSLRLHIPALKLKIVDSDERHIYQCRWVDNFGPSFVKSAELLVGGQVIQKITGEWLYAHNRLYQSIQAQNAVLKMNSIPFVEPNEAIATGVTNVVTSNEAFIHIDIPFYTSTSSLALPLIALQYTVIEVRIILRPINDVILFRKKILLDDTVTGEQ